jgi:hypothetical protein
MKSFLIGLTAILVFVTVHAANRPASGGRGGASTSHFNPPKYNRPFAPSRPSGGESHGGAPSAHASVPVRHDTLGNHITDDHMNRVNYANNRADNVMRNNAHVNDVVRIGRAHFANKFRPEFEQKRTVFNEMNTRYNHFAMGSPLILDVWHRHHFFGGFYYGFHPILDIDTYFYNPSVYWFYAGTFDEDYYRSWYQDHYDEYPEFHKSFEYHGVYYPTENLRQLLFGVSAMPPEKQAAFRDAITAFTQRLAQNMANGLGTRVTLTQGDAVVTHYEIIGYDDAIVLEGMVSHNGNAYNFRGLLDLGQPQQTAVFVPATWDKNPTPQQLAELDALNAKVDALKGVPPSAPTEPEPADVPAPPPGQAIAEPQHM